MSRTLIGIVISFIVVHQLDAQCEPSAGEAEIASISFESIPDGTTLGAGGGLVTLDADTNVTQDLFVQGVVGASAGVRFPDGSIQNTAANLAGLSANSGMYDNTIIDFTPPFPYTEVCLKEGSVQADIHVIAESTAGGNCLPGDLGWVIERDERSGANWREAKLQCLLVGMRLPELFEWLTSCDNSGMLGLNDMTGSNEWASNSAFPSLDSGTVAARAGRNDCNDGNWGYVVKPDSAIGVNAYRCVR